MLKVGLTGNVGAGKSAVAEIWRTGRGARIIDADALGVEALQPGKPAFLRLAEVFGQGVLKSDGSLDRRETGRIAFGSPGSLQRLNSIVQPEIRAGIERELEKAGREGVEVVVVDAALVFEFGLDKKLDLIVTVDAPLEERKRRMLAKGKMSEATLDRVMAAQLPPEELVRRADYVIENDGDTEILKQRALEAFDRILRGEKE